MPNNIKSIGRTSAKYQLHRAAHNLSGGEPTTPTHVLDTTHARSSCTSNDTTRRTPPTYNLSSPLVLSYIVCSIFVKNGPRLHISPTNTLCYANGHSTICCCQRSGCGPAAPHQCVTVGHHGGCSIHEAIPKTLFERFDFLLLAHHLVPM